MKIHRAKKSLGQNFLKSEGVIKKIITAGEVTDKDMVLEIGPGKGAITKKLLASTGRVIAVEKDPELLEFLKIKFEKEIHEGRLTLVCEDILNFHASTYSLGPRAYKVIANIPYNITGAILKKFLTEKHPPALMVLLVQKEVAERIVARDKKESILSISVKSYGKPSIIDKVPARYFTPQPKIDSSIIKITDISRDFFLKNDIDEEKFWEIVKKGFAHKRKRLGSNLKNVLGSEKIQKSGLGDKRAEDVTLAEWISLAR